MRFTFHSKISVTMRKKEEVAMFGHQLFKYLEPNAAKRGST
jgi:hypothetical protein